MTHIDPVDVDAFYSSPPLDVWRRVLGDRMHYHHGIWEADEDWDAALDNAVLTLARHVEPGSTVLDLGCGWGGPATVLAERLGCHVIGVTVSQAQASYCARARPRRSPRGSRPRHAGRAMVGRMVDGIAGAPGAP